MYQRIGKAAYKADLETIQKLDEYFQHPHRHFKTVHVGGTNGKGSVSSMIASVLQEAGFKTGLYTSPHLKDYRERIKINEKEIPEEFVTDFVWSHQKIIEQIQPSFFEITQMMAFQYFKQQKADVAVIEVGMGGRLDSTNIIYPELSVITNIGYDHVQFLGNTLEQIAFEKAGIIKPETPVIIGKKQPETENIFISKARELNALLFFSEDFPEFNYACDLKGSYQKENIQTAAVVIEVLRKKISISQKAIERGFANVVKNTGIKGRWQILNEKPLIIADTAHNKEGLYLVLKQIKQQKFKNLHIVLGMVNDKAIDEILDLFPKDAVYY
ncbi:MAG: bifunctional folylpolyglutamate synthase/dihydrofolate synthase, partial [Bacteroidetes bacterium]